MRHMKTGHLDRFTRSVSSFLIAGIVGVAGLLGVTGAGCGGDGSITFSTTVQVVDEAGQPVVGATVDLERESFTTGNDGTVALRDLESPVVALISGDGLITEPIPIGRSDADQTVAVRMLSDNGGKRWVMHAGGDAMFGRRYVEPPEGEPLIRVDRAGEGARYVVDNLTRAFGVADLRTLNLETVVSTLSDDSIYPGKRFILNSHPDTLDGIQALQTDLVTLGNNHARDYGDVGVAETIRHLDARGIAHVGGSADDPADAYAPRILEVAGVKVAFLSYTTVHGSFVNDNYPLAEVETPRECLATPPTRTDCFKYEARMWGFSGNVLDAAMEPRRIGDAWKLFKDAETGFDTDSDGIIDRKMSDEENAAAWDSMFPVYPELQDWVARRGHGGAAFWVTSESKADIADVRALADVVVVHLHSGFQFQTAPSAFVRTVARHSIDAGADLVIAHHPHVLQGAEWYKDRLINYSLGNFIFDQDFLATFPSVFLRTVWDGSDLVEARFVLLELVGYRPTPVTDQIAVRTANMLWERSALGAYSDRDINRDIRTYMATEPSPDTQVAHIRLRNHGAVIERTAPETEELRISLNGGETKAIEYDGLIHAQAGGADVLMGRDLFGWGHFEDVLADGVPHVGAQWTLPLSGGDYDPSVKADPAARSGFGYVEIPRVGGLNGETFVRPVARTPMPEHMLYRNENDVAIPVDGTAIYSIRLLARLEGSGTAYLKLELNQFDDTNPTEDPTTESIGEIDLPLDLDGDGKWRTIEVDIDPAKLIIRKGGEDIRANVIMTNIRFTPPDKGESRLSVDDLQLIEWRPASEISDQFGAYELLRNNGDSKVTVTLEAMPLRD